jgi:hypothetical protein
MGRYPHTAATKDREVVGYSLLVIGPRAAEFPDNRQPKTNNRAKRARLTEQAFRHRVGA